MQRFCSIFSQLLQLFPLKAGFCFCCVESLTLQKPMFHRVLTCNADACLLQTCIRHDRLRCQQHAERSEIGQA